MPAYSGMCIIKRGMGNGVQLQFALLGIEAVQQVRIKIMEKDNEPGTTR